MENAQKAQQGRFIFYFQFSEQNTFFLFSKGKFVYFSNDLTISPKNNRNVNKQMRKKQGALKISLVCSGILSIAV